MAPRENAEIARRLADVPLFTGLSADTLARIVSLAHAKSLQAGELFFSEGDQAKAFFVLTSGRVKLTQLTPEGHQVVLRLIGPGDAFGGVGAFGEPVYPVGAEAVEPSVALAWVSTTMRQLLETEPTIAVNALRFVASRLHDLQQRYRQAMTERVERRVARALLRLVREAGRRVDSGVEITFAVSRQDIAEMTGTTLYTVSRLLSAWEAQGIVQSGRQHIVLTKPHALVAIAEDLPSR
ncbi:MAG TPA: Crp/Fnr family transcriptional regulator [Vicinamibacterales bacterium]|nr:Crp/Fnr family transcriptional regulator [Vicinamibacterales bacterium]